MQALEYFIEWEINTPCRKVFQSFLKGVSVNLHSKCLRLAFGCEYSDLNGSVSCNSDSKTLIYKSEITSASNYVMV